LENENKLSETYNIFMNEVVVEKQNVEEQSKIILVWNMKLKEICKMIMKRNNAAAFSKAA